MSHNKLPGGMDGVSKEIDGGPVKAVPSGEKRVERRRAEMVEGELGGRKKIRPAIRGKGYVARRQDGKEVVLSCSDGPFRAVSAVVLGGNILHLDLRLRRAKESVKVSRSLIVHLDMSNGTGVRRKEGTGRTKGMNIGGRGARLEGNEMNIIAMK
jgi:hypothetical protein